MLFDVFAAQHNALDGALATRILTDKNICTVTGGRLVNLLLRIAAEQTNYFNRQTEEGLTMIVVTHEMGFAREVSNKVVFLHKGQIEEQGEPNEVLLRPRSERLQAFLSNSLK